jgi:hypothetical protein
MLAAGATECNERWIEPIPIWCTRVDSLHLNDAACALGRLLRAYKNEHANGLSQFYSKMPPGCAFVSSHQAVPLQFLQKRLMRMDLDIAANPLAQRLLWLCLPIKRNSIRSITCLTRLSVKV